MRRSLRRGERATIKLHTVCQAPGCANDISHKRGHAKWCSSSCTMKGYRALHPGRQRAYWVKSVYGLTVEQFDELLASQGNACAICSKPAGLTPGVRTDQWNIDHCHETGAVRGILCSPCNIGIGQLGDDPERLRAALCYLETHLAKQAQDVR